MRLLYFLLPLCSGFLFSGATRPLGFWDPLELSKSLEVGHLAFMREAELKHGRTAMLAVLGIFIGEKFPLFYDHAITGPAITHFTQVQNIFPAFWVAPTLLTILSLIHI